MTSAALQELISYAPTWYHSIQERLAYYPHSGKTELRYDVFTSQGPDKAHNIFLGPDLRECIDSAKNWIYIHRIEEILCPPTTSHDFCQTLPAFDLCL